ncbi:MAG TPA: TolC family protein [Vicinamibacteria bacterium]|jgi:outer membrane protein|nr:TolC family protein [Vicinamibacteria bacterium]
MRRRTRVLVAVAVALILPRPGLAEERPVLELSLDDAVKRALDNNLDIAVDRFNPTVGAEGVRQALGAYDPFLSATLSTGSQESPATSAFSGGTKVSTDTQIWNFGVNQYLPTGGTFNLTFNSNKSDTNSVFTTFNPTFTSFFSLNLTQPLLRNFKLDSAREGIRVAKKSREISDVQFRQTVINTVASTKQGYYDLIAAIDNLDAQQKSLDLAKKLLNENEIKVRVGTLAPLDVVSAQAEVASREEGVIRAEAAILDTEDALKRLIFPKNDPATWDLRIVPKDRPNAEPVRVDVGTAIQNALEKRTDVVVARKNLEKADISVDFARSQVLPQVDLVASYGSTGVGGTGLKRQSLGGPIVSTVPGGYGDAAGDALGIANPTWTVRLNLTYPLMNRAAAAQSAQARLFKDQALISFQLLELQVAQQVRVAARAVETNSKRIATTRAARVLQEQRLDAEEKKFAAGMSTNFLVTQAQRDLADARVAEIQAIADYSKSVVELQRVQEAGVSGSGGVATVSTGTGNPLAPQAVTTSSTGTTSTSRTTTPTSTTGTTTTASTGP